MNKSSRIETDTKRNLILIRLVILVLILAYNLFNYFRGIQYIGDDYWYWFAGNSFYKEGHFSILNFSSNPDTFRGYIIPLITLAIRLVTQKIGVNHMLVYEIISALFFTYFITKLVPSIYELIEEGKKAKGYQILMLFVLLTLFWRGFYVVLLSDFYAVAALLLALKYLLLEKNNEKSSYFFWSGLFSGLFVLIRLNYQYSFYLIIIYIVITISSRNKSLYNIVSNCNKNLLIFLVGTMIICFPQLIINQRHGVISAFPYDGIVKVQGTTIEQKASLTALQGGIGLQKVLPGMYYDPHGINVMHRYYGYPRAVEGGNYTGNDFLRLWKEHTMTNLGEYLNIVMKYPLDFACIYVRHFFDGLDVRSHLYGTKETVSYGSYYAFINYTILFVVLLVLYQRWKRTRLTFMIMLAIFFMPSILTIPGHIECRYFLTFHVFLYTVFCFFVDFSTPFALDKRYVAKYSIIYFLFVLLCFTFSSSILYHI